MDRFDLVEGLGIALLVAFAAVVWWPAAFLVAGVALIVEAQFRSLAAKPDAVDEPAPEDEPTGDASAGEVTP